eukprot:6377807-Amphidinium_carterae.1
MAAKQDLIRTASDYPSLMPFQQPCYIIRVLSMGAVQQHSLPAKAIELSSDTLKNVKFIQEKRLITKFLDEVEVMTAKIC